jgi:hypothetical protein
MRYVPPQSSGATVVLPYIARQRNGFANCSFTVKRGVNVITPPTASGPVAAGSFAPGETVLDLLSRMPAPQPPLSPPCTIGAFLAFLEDLYVAATATDGWSRLSRHDAHDSRAVTLAPQ